MWHEPSAKSFLIRTLKICLFGALFFISPKIQAQTTSAISTADKELKDKTTAAFILASGIQEGNGNYSEAARILADNRKLLESSRVWDDPIIGKRTMAIQWYLEGRNAKLLNQFENARFCLSRAKELFQDLEDEGHPNSNMINTLSQLGTLHENIGELDNSEHFQKQVLEKVAQYIRDSVKNIGPKDSAYAYSGLGNIYLERSAANRGYLESESLADLQKAHQYFRKSLDIRLAHSLGSPNFEKIALSYENLATSLLRMDSLDAAMAAADQARKNLKLATWANQNEQGFLSMLYAEIYMRKGDFAKAESEYAKAYEIRKQGDFKFPPNLSAPLDGMARAAEKQDHLDQALDLCDLAYLMLIPVDFRTRLDPDLPYKAQKIEVLSTKANILFGMKKKNDALHSYLEIADLAANLRGEAPTEQAQFHTSGNDLVLNAHCEGVHIALDLYKETGDTKYFDLAFELSEKSKAAVLLESFRKNSFLQLAINGMRGEEAIPFKKLQQQDMEISRLKRIQGNQRNLQIATALGDTIMKLQQQYQDSLQSLKENYVGKFPAILRGFEAQSNISPTEVQQQILSRDPSRAMISYTLCRGRLSTLILTHNRRWAHEQDLNEHFHKNLEALINKLRSQGDGKLNEAAVFQAVSEYIYSILIEPHRARLEQAGIRRLVIIPDGQLSYLSFDALLKPSESVKNIFKELRKDFLIQQFYLSYEYSATILQERQDKHRALPSNMVGVFAPFDFQKAKGLPEISQAAKKVCRATNGTWYGNLEANRVNFLDTTDLFDVIIAATHSKADDQFPANSVMLLANPDDPEQYDSLFAYQFYHSPLKVNHLFLASCETGTGKLRRGEGVLSLARGITVAGCASATVSLWNVVEDSATTGDIMRSYFEKLALGEQKDVALGKAKREFLNGDHKGDRYYRPFSWAELIITGDTAPTPMQWRDNRDIWLIGTLILAAILLIVGWRMKRKFRE
jgi:CHAT domain-containing protein